MPNMGCAAPNFGLRSSQESTIPMTAHFQVDADAPVYIWKNKQQRDCLKNIVRLTAHVGCRSI